MSYRPKIKSNSSGSLTDLALDAETVAGHSVEATGVASNTTTLPTTAQVKSFVEGKGYLTSHQSIKTLNTNNTTAQTVSSSEAIKGSGTINLHKVSKTGSYNDLLDKPTIPTNTNQTVKGNGTAFGANAAVNIVGGTNVTVTADTTNNKITIAASAPVADATTKGIAMLATGDMNGATHTDGVAVSKNHTHSQYLPLAGGIMSGNIDMKGSDLQLKTGGSESNDSGDISFWYGNGGEKGRIWTDNTFTSSTKHKGPNWRAFDTASNQLINTNLLLADKGEIIDSLGLGNVSDSAGWGTVTPANGYSQLLVTGQPTGGGLIFGEKNGQTSIQIDGDFFGQEGNKQVEYKFDAAMKFVASLDSNTYAMDISNDDHGAAMVFKAYGGGASTEIYCYYEDDGEEVRQRLCWLTKGIVIIQWATWTCEIKLLGDGTVYTDAIDPRTFTTHNLYFTTGSTRAILYRLKPLEDREPGR